MLKKKAMGNDFSTMPQAFSDSNQTRVYDYRSMATYRQFSTTADQLQIGQTQMGVGVKLLQDWQPGPNQGELYVVDNSGRKQYFTKGQKLVPRANEIIAQGKDYGNGMAVAITGSPAQPKYQMFYAPGGDMWSGSNQWTPVLINSKRDIEEAVRGGDTGRSGKYASMYGNASVNPFAARKGADFFTGLTTAGRAVGGFASKLVLPLAETAIDTMIPLGSLMLQVTGIHGAAQGQIDKMVDSLGEGYHSAQKFDPEVANMIQDPRLPNFLQAQESQMHQYVSEVGDADYKPYQGLAQYTPSQMLRKAQAIHNVNENNYVQQQSQKLIDTATQLQDSLHSKMATRVIAEVQRDLSRARDNNQKIQVINRYTGIVQNHLLPLLDSATKSVGEPLDSSSYAAQSDSIQTASAQVGHPTLSINGDPNLGGINHEISGDSA